MPAGENSPPNRPHACESCKLRATIVAHFCHSVGGFPLFQSRNQSASVFCPGNYLSKGSGTRGAKGTGVLLRAGIDKERGSIGRSSLQEIGGSCRYQRGKSNRAASFVGFRLQLEGRRVSRDAPGAVIKSLAREEERWEGQNNLMLTNRSTVRKFVRRRRVFPSPIYGRSQVHAAERCSLRSAWKYAYLFHAPVRLTRHVE